MDISDYYTRAYESYRENLNIVVPSVLGTVLTFILVVIGVLIVLFGVFGTEFLESLVSSSQNISADFIQSSAFASKMLFAVVIFIIIALIAAIIDSFIYASTVGLSKQIIMNGRSDLNYGWENGKKYLLRIFLVRIIISLAYIVLFGVLMLGLLFLRAFASGMLGFSIFILGGIIIFILAILLSLIFMVVHQSIVISEKSVLESIKDSYQLFLENKMQVFLVALINFVISVSVSIVLGLIPYVGSFLNMIVSMLLLPYFVLVLSFLYVDLKGFAVEEPSDAYPSDQHSSEITENSN